MWILLAILSVDFYQPFKEDELEQSTEVQIIYLAEPKPVITFIEFFPGDLTVFGLFGILLCMIWLCNE